MFGLGAPAGDQGTCLAGPGRAAGGSLCVRLAPSAGRVRASLRGLGARGAVTSGDTLAELEQPGARQPRRSSGPAEGAEMTCRGHLRLPGENGERHLAVSTAPLSLPRGAPAKGQAPVADCVNFMEFQSGFHSALGVGRYTSRFNFLFLFCVGNANSGVCKRAKEPHTSPAGNRCAGMVFVFVLLLVFFFVFCDISC